MRIYIYSGGLGLVGKSGVGQAIRQQWACLRRAGIPAGDSWTPETAAIHVNTVLPDSVAVALLAPILVFQGMTPSSMVTTPPEFALPDVMEGYKVDEVRYCQNEQCSAMCPLSKLEKGREGVCPVCEAARIARKAHNSVCGHGTFCRDGMYQLYLIPEDISKGQGTKDGIHKCMDQDIGI